MIDRHDFELRASIVICLFAVLVMVSCTLAGCAATPAVPEPVVQTVKVDVPYPVMCAAGLPPKRDKWPLDEAKSGPQDVRTLARALVDDDAAWRDYARAYEAATAGCR